MLTRQQNAAPQSGVLFFRGFAILSAVFFCCVFFFSQIVEAFRFPMWEDEIFGLQESIRSHSYLDLILKGASGQGSPSPLDYLIHKTIDHLQNVVHFNLPEQVYYRLFPNFVTAMMLLAIVIWFSFRFASKTQLIILSVIPICFLNQFQIYKYAHEMRPYALWVALYLMSLAIIVNWEEMKRNQIVAALTFLALTATASLFQISCMSVISVSLKISERAGIRKSIFDTMKIFGLPLTITLYYCLRAGQWGYGPEWSKWEEFYSYWSHQWLLVPLMLISSILLFRSPKFKMNSIAPLSLLLLYLIGPAIFWTARARGFFYADRQYLYYELARPVFLLCLAKSFPQLTAHAGKKLSVLLVIVVLIVSFSIGVREKYINRFTASISNSVELFSNKVF